MKHSIKLLLEHLRYEPDTGLVFWKLSKSGRDIAKPVGHFDNEGYLRVIFEGTRYRLHRLVYVMATQQEIPAGFQVDHINGQRADNRLENLRLVKSRQNNLNRKMHRNGKLIGAHFHKASGRWTSSIRIGKQTKSLGYFDTDVEAHEAYVRALEIEA
jgi:hypothetical protein